jgi:phosphohistidine phosphatase
VVKGLAALDPGIEEVLTSPLVRARQTAELLTLGLDGHPPVRVLDALAPGYPPGRLISAIGAVTRRPRLALVGHEPDLGLLAAFLIGAGRAIPLKKGGVCRIDIGSPTAESSGTLVWLATPGMLRRLRRS